jgi:heme/copper-type cytochrome/quinol oxidase subunit 2
MKRKIVRSLFCVVGLVFIFIFGVLMGYTVNGRKRESYVMYSEPSSDTNLDEDITSIKEQTLKSFSFAYNTTHLWSMRLADKNHYDITRSLPCRTVIYVGGPTNESMNSCDQSTSNEYSIKATIHAQKWLYEYQNPRDCANKKFAIIRNFAWSGFGSTVHQILWAFGTALGLDRIAIYQTPGNWVRHYQIIHKLFFFVPTIEMINVYIIVIRYVQVGHS